MRLSLLLPTRNGASLLEGCLRSVLDNPYPDLEIVVSDNASDDGTPAILERLAAEDPRIRSVRQPRMLSVTENWSAAFREATGDYVLLIGDDDLLLPTTVVRLRGLLERHRQPDCLSVNGYLYAYPGALAPGSVPHLADPFMSWADGLPRDGELPMGQRRHIVEALLGFEVGFSLNLQTTLVSRVALDSLPRGPFRDPYPDFYAVIALLLRARRWVHTEDRLVVVGISPKSFGATLKREDAGALAGYLGVRASFPGSLPGSELVNGLHATLDALYRDLPADMPGLRPNRDAYVAAQLVVMVQQTRAGLRDRRSLLRALRQLSLYDWAGVARRVARRLAPANIRGLAGLARPDATAAHWTGLEPSPEAVDAAALLQLLERREGASP